MKFKFVKNYYLKKAIDRQVKDRENQHIESEFKTVAVLVDIEEFEKKDAFNSLIESLEILNKDLKVVCYSESESKVPMFEQNIFSSKDFSWKGDFNNPAVDEFCQRHYDIFIGYYNKKNQFLDYIASKVSAALKIGFDKPDFRIFDIAFKMDIKNYAVFETELVKYINIFKKNKAS